MSPDASTATSWIPRPVWESNGTTQSTSPLVESFATKSICTCANCEAWIRVEPSWIEHGAVRSDSLGRTHPATTHPSGAAAIWWR
jgi:hypothetical protein